MTVMQRAIRRAGFPIEYTKGFHPTQKLSLGPPLGVGIAGKREYFDMEIVPPFDLRSNTRKINATLPEGIYVNDMAVVPAHAQSLNSFITRYEYLIGGADYSNADAFLSEKTAQGQAWGNYPAPPAETNGRARRHKDFTLWMERPVGQADRKIQYQDC
jgi:radical SAM-linked protein